VLKVLAEIGAAQIPQILIMNKMDRLPPEARSHSNARALAVSALTGAGIDKLLEAIDEALPLDPIVRRHFSPFGRRRSFHGSLHEFGQGARGRVTTGSIASWRPRSRNPCQRRVENIVEERPGDP